jgi:hypothetical protein
MESCDVKEWSKTLMLSFLAVATVLYLLEPDMVMRVNNDGDIVICYRKLFSVALMIAIVITITSVCVEGTQLKQKEIPFIPKPSSKMSSKIKTY